MPFTKNNIQQVRKDYENLCNLSIADILLCKTEGMEDYLEKNKALVMVSGGKDSTVVLGLACRAVGSENVIAVTAPFENDKSDILDTSIEVIKYFQIPTQNYIHSPIKVMAKDNIVCNSQDAIKDGLGNYQMQVLEWDKNKPEDRNLAARIRMLKAYYFAQKFNARVINTSNLSENIAGWFTKWGDCVGDYYPLSDLTASEVVLLGLEMSIPEKYMFRVPDDGLIGTSDEEALGFTYNELDKWIWKVKNQQNYPLDIYSGFDILPENMLKRFRDGHHKRFFHPQPLSPINEENND